jgi:hypothetical protein
MVPGRVVSDAMRIIGQIGRHTIVTLPDESVEPGHQRIAVTPADLEGSALLFALTGNNASFRGVPRLAELPNGDLAWDAPHDDRADERLVRFVDVCADLRFTAPDMIQLEIEGFDDD